MAKHFARFADGRLDALFAELPAILITGPRASGKTTSASRLAQTVVHLDQPAQAAAFRADPDAALSIQPEPVLLDEWQEVPDVLGAVRRAIHRDGHAGRFLLTGSVRRDPTQKVWAGTGRITGMSMHGLTMREQTGRLDGPGFLARLGRADLSLFRVPKDAPNLTGYVDLALRGGFPEPIAMDYSSETLTQWLRSYVDQLLTHDVPGLVRDPSRLRRFFDAMCLSTAGTPTDATLYGAAGIDAKTAQRYFGLLEDVYVLHNVPAYVSSRIRRLVKLPKRYIIDPALVGAALGMGTREILGDSDLFGRLLDTFVMAQIRPELDVDTSAPRLFHLRDGNGDREIDLLGEHGRKIVGLEVKASASPDSGDARHLAFLRETLGDRFLAGAVLHTGPGMFEIGPRTFAIPICAIWG